MNEEPSARLYDKLHKANAYISDTGALGGWVVFSQKTNLPLTSRTGLPLSVFEAGVTEPGKDDDADARSLADRFVDWRYLHHRNRALTDIALGYLHVVDMRRYLRSAADWVQLFHEIARVGRNPSDILIPNDILSAMAFADGPYVPNVVFAAREIFIPREPHFSIRPADRELLETIREEVGSAWSAAEYPQSSLTNQQWHFLFTDAGFRVDGKPASPGEGKIRLYRGSVAERRTAWSWTDRFEVAHSFAHMGKGYRPKGEVWTTLVDRTRAYARNHGRTESEWVIAVRDDEIELATEDCSCGNEEQGEVKDARFAS